MHERESQGIQSARAIGEQSLVHLNPVRPWREIFANILSRSAVLASGKSATSVWQALKCVEQTQAFRRGSGKHHRRSSATVNASFGHLSGDFLAGLNCVEDLRAFKRGSGD